MKSFMCKVFVPPIIMLVICGAVWADDDGYVEVNEETFPDPVFREYVIRNVLRSKLGYVTDVTRIYVQLTKSLQQTELTSLKGIEYFTNLKDLRCIAKKQRIQLTEIDVTKNLALERLYCDGNQLSALDVSKNTALKYLSCASNYLTALDVTRNSALRSLQCTNNQLTTLDVSKNTELLL